MEMKLFLRRLFSVGLLIIVSIFLLSFVSYAIFNKRNKKYLAAYYIKINRLKETSGKKRLILLGGSATAFSLSSEMLRDSLHMEVVNCGLHADAGLNNEVDFFYKYFNKKTDIIVILPEYDIMTKFEQDYKSEVSIYTKSLMPVAFPDPFVWTYFLQRNNPVTYLKEILVSRDYTVYHKDNFNKYGDISHYPAHWKYVMPTFRKKYVINFTPNLQEAVKYIQQKFNGFEYYIAPTPIHSVWSQSSLHRYDGLMRKDFGSRYIVNSAATQHVLNDSLFYNTIFHPTAAGKEIYTNFIIKSLKAQINK